MSSKTYRISLYETYDTDDTVLWVAKYPDFVGIIGVGHTKAEAIAEAEEGLSMWLEHLENVRVSDLMKSKAAHKKKRDELEKEIEELIKSRDSFRKTLKSHFYTGFAYEWVDTKVLAIVTHNINEELKAISQSIIRRERIEHLYVRLIDLEANKTDKYYKSKVKELTDRIKHEEQLLKTEDEKEKYNVYKTKQLLHKAR